MTQNFHDGHRERMRARIVQNGLDSLQSHEVLEYLLYAFIPRKDTNEIAHELISTFGSLSKVLNADYEHILAVKGMTQNAAIFLASLPDLLRLYAVETEAERFSVKGRKKAREYMRNKLYGVNVEQLFAAAIDAHDQLIHCERLEIGSGDGVNVSVRKIVDFALKNKASCIVLAHNHPSGNIKPSQSDYALTREIAWTLSSVGCTLQDHYIFNATDYFSFEEVGTLKLMMQDKDLSFKEGYNYYE